MKQFSGSAGGVCSCASVFPLESLHEHVGIQQDCIQVAADGAWQKPYNPSQALGQQLGKLIWLALHS